METQVAEADPLEVLHEGAPDGAADEAPLDAAAQKGIQALAGDIAAQLLPDLIKRLVSAGVEQLTDEGLHKLGADVEVPGDLDGVVAEDEPRVRREISRLLRKEMREFVAGTTVSQEIHRLLSSVTFEIKTEIRLRPTDDTTPRVRSRVRLKRTDSDPR
jgi:Flp pilus assembly CpaE family ATPase